MVRAENPTYIATQDILWLRIDGNKVLIQASLGIPYRTSDSWACPAALIGVDGRYPDFVGVSSFQSLTLAIRLIRQRLGHLLEAGEVLVFPNHEDDIVDSKVLDAVLGTID